MPSKLIADGINIFVKLGLMSKENSLLTITRFDEFLPSDYNTEKRHKNAERQRRYTERQRQKSSCSMGSEGSNAFGVSSLTGQGQAT